MLPCLLHQETERCWTKIIKSIQVRHLHLDFLFCFCLPSAGDQTQDHMYAKQVLCHPAVRPVQELRCLPVGLFLINFIFSYTKSELVKKYLARQRIFLILFKLKYLLVHPPKWTFLISVGRVMLRGIRY